MYGGGDSYRDQEIYPGDAGYRSQNTGYSLYSGNTGLSVDLPSPDSGIGPDQVKIVFSYVKNMPPFDAPSPLDKNIGVQLSVV